MEAFAFYLLKSVIWLTGFALVFIIFLRNERFFFLNRIYLVTGILTSFVFPLVSIHYTVVLPVVTSVQTDGAVVSEIQNTGKSIIPDLKFILSVLYVTGVLFVFTVIIRQGRSVLRTIKKSEVCTFHPVKLIRTTDYTSAFSFFSYVFVNPSVTDLETKEIMNHELVHIRQKHWFDLVLVELLCMMQWFNPLVWIYVRFIRQNHEYLADEVALQRTSDPAIYRAALLNQIVGAPVVSLANFFNYSLNKKRFNMMKNIISSPYRKMKIFFILPVFAIVLYAFAKPDYKYKIIDQSSGNPVSAASQVQHEVTGTVVQKNGNPLSGAIITLKNTTIGTISDAAGSFKFVNVPDDGVLFVSYVGFKSKAIKPDFKAPMIIMMVRDTVQYSDINISTPPPPPPPPPAEGVTMGNMNDAPPPPPPPPPFGLKFKGDGPPPLFVVDGVVVTEGEAESIDPAAVESINVMKDRSSEEKHATDKYGEKGKNGVIEITTKKMRAGSIDKNAPPPPPPPPLSDFKIKSIDGKTPLVVVDGVVKDKNFDINLIDPNSIESISVLKSQSAVALYGGKAEDGVILISSKKAFVVVEEMPKFPGGGNDAMVAWINSNLKYPGEAFKDKITGKVLVNFIVSGTGKVKNVVVSKSVHPLLDAEAKRVISSMPDWKPGSQSGKPVDVQVCVPVEFKLK